MGCGNPSPLASPVEGHRELADFLPIPPLSNPDFEDAWMLYPPESKNENDRSAGHMDLNCSADPFTSSNFCDLKTHGSTCPRESESPSPQVNIRDLSHGIDGNNSIVAGCLKNTSLSLNSENNMNFMPVPVRGSITGGCPMKTQAAQAENSAMNRLEMRGKLSSVGCSRSSTSVADNFGTKRTKDCFNTVPFQFNSPVNVDGSFLTLGIGGGTEMSSSSKFSREIASKSQMPRIGDGIGFRSNSKLSSQEIASDLEIRSNNKFSTREIATKLAETVPSQFLGRVPKDSTDFTQSTSKAGILSNSASNLVDRLSLIPLPSLQSPLANGQPYFPAKSLAPSPPSESMLISHPESATSSLLVSGPTKPQSSDLTDLFLLDQPFSHPECVSLSAMGPKPAKPPYLARPPSNWPPDYLRKSSMTGFANHPLLNWNTGSSIHPLQQEGTTVEMPKFGPFPRSGQPVGHLYPYHNVGTTEAIGNNSFPNRIGFQSSRGVPFHPAAGASFPKRLGLQPNYSRPPRIVEGYLQKTQNGGLVNSLEAPVRHPLANGPPPHLAVPYNAFRPLVNPGPFPVHLASQINPYSPSVPAGQQPHGMPTQFSQDPLLVHHPNVPVVPVAKLEDRSQPPSDVYHSSSKRKAAETSAPVRVGQRRKTIPKPVVITHRKPTIPAMAPIPAVPMHIKWKGCDDPPKPIGQKCLLCKRDLSFTAEGPVFQPTAPPAVAVLPCGHTFHDHCLHTITPEDQVKNPPCIPCAIGET